MFTTDLEKQAILQTTAMLQMVIFFKSCMKLAHTQRV